MHSTYDMSVGTDVNTSDGGGSTGRTRTLKRKHSSTSTMTASNNISSIATAATSKPVEQINVEEPTCKRLASNDRNTPLNVGTSSSSSSATRIGNSSSSNSKKISNSNEENDRSDNDNVPISRWQPSEVAFAIGEDKNLDTRERAEKLCAHLNTTDLSKMYGVVPDDPDMLSPEYIHYRSLTEQERAVRREISKTKRSQRKKVREKHRRELGNHYLEHLRMLLGLNMGTSVVEIVHAACDMMERYSRQAVVAECQNEGVGTPTA